jgi:tRNA (cmo5U34)-methyltransferase
MDSEQLKSLFDQQAPAYDAQWARMAPIRDGLHLLMGSVLAQLPARARILCVGAGTGAEILYLAGRYPGWTFTAVELSAGMLAVCRQRASDAGCAARCGFHEGEVDTLPEGESFDGATALLVSQFLLDPSARSAFFRAIAGRLRPGGLLVSSDLAFDVASAAYPGMLETWMRTMATADIDPAGLERLRAAYQRDVAIAPPKAVEALIAAGGFGAPVQFYQAGLIHAWHACVSTPPDAGHPCAA